ncbi:alpha/beta-hydrolase [Atractiella rhizophila]|nr:alpha/beta-hydrolase [Atractiella rhizophila]
MTCFLLLLLGLVQGMAAAEQVHLRSSVPSVILGSSWGSLGPFQVGTREYPLLHPDGPVLPFGLRFSNLSFDSPEVQNIPSTLAPGGKAVWKEFHASVDDGTIVVSYPEVDWDFLRKTGGGWSALQHYVLLRTSLLVYAPPSSLGASPQSVTISVNLIGGTDFYLLPSTRTPLSPSEQLETYLGDIYQYSPLSASDANEWGHSIEVIPGEYTLVVRAAYDARARGGAWDDGIPKIEFRVVAGVREEASFVKIPGSEVEPDAVDGYIMGVGVGVGVRWTGKEKGAIEDVAVVAPDGLKASLADGPLSFETSQTRQISFLLNQTTSLLPLVNSSGGTIEISLLLLPSRTPVTFTIKSLLMPSPPSTDFSFAMTHQPPSLPISLAVVTPPTSSPAQFKCQSKGKTILYLHGAGASPLAQDIRTSFPPQEDAWIVFPLGRTEWGMDWHGPSIIEARYAARGGLEVVKRVYCRLQPEQTYLENKLVVVGHSNGGQGTWYLTERWPDEILAAVPASGYTRIDEYIPYHTRHSRFLQDPALTSVLLSSLLPYDNALHASNLYGVPVLHRHGDEDDNVPVFHGRVMKHLLQQWSHNVSLSQYEEVPGAPHFWPEVFDVPSVQAFLDKIPVFEAPKQKEWSLTISTANVDEGGTKFGWRIRGVNVRGQLARLHLTISGDEAWLSGQNVQSASFDRTLWPGKLRRVHLDDILLDIDEDGDEILSFHLKASKHVTETRETHLRTSGPVAQILVSNGPLTIVYVNDLRDKRAALRIAHNIWVYLRIDAVVEKWKGSWTHFKSKGNVVLVDEDGAVQSWGGSLRVQKDTFSINTKAWSKNDFGVITLLPHPSYTNSPALAVRLTGRLEAVEPLFPIQTGVTVPEFAVVGPTQWGERGVVAAGWYNDEWEVEDRSSYL